MGVDQHRGLGGHYAPALPGGRAGKSSGRAGGIRPDHGAKTISLKPAAVFHQQLAVGARRQFRIVRDDGEGRAGFPVHARQQLEHIVRGMAVEVAGGLVGQHAGRPRHQCARQRHALAFAAGQLAGIVLFARGQTHHAQHLARARGPARDPGAARSAAWPRCPAPRIPAADGGTGRRSPGSGCAARSCAPRTDRRPACRPP